MFNAIYGKFNIYIMNNTQRKILFKKIIPYSLILIIIISGLIAIPIIRGYGNKIEKENEEWFSKQENIEKIKANISNQVDNTIKVKSLVVKYDDWNISDKSNVNSDDVGMLLLTNEEDFFNILFTNEKDFHSLEDYFLNQREKIYRNLTNQGIILESSKKREQIIKERLTIIEVFKCVFNGQKEPDLVVMSMQYKDYYYTISYPLSSQKVYDLFEKIYFED